MVKHRRSELLPVENEALPERYAAFPSGNEALVRVNGAFPVENEVFPVKNEAFLRRNGTFPVENGALPVGSKVFPVKNEAFARRNEALPVENETSVEWSISGGECRVMDDFRIYSRGATQDELQGLYSRRELFLNSNGVEPQSALRAQRNTTKQRNTFLSPYSPDNGIKIW